MSRLPIRIRLTLPFALAMALVLAALGAYVYVRVGSTLLSSTDQSLLAQATEATLRVDRGKPPLDLDSANGARFAQVLDGSGAVVVSQPPGLAALLTPAQARSVSAGGSLRASTSFGGEGDRWRLLAIPDTAGGQHHALVLASSLDARSESLERLRRELLVASPLALLLATLAGYALAGAALRPVEEMRRKAAKISAATPGDRLPVPVAKDEVQRLAETLNDMLARLETAFEHERRFVADASHELRTPLALLKTELELALRHPRTRAELEEALRSAAEETDRLSALAADLLLIARADQGGLPVSPERLEAGEVLATVAERFSGRAAGLGRRIEVDEGEVAFAADPRRIEQALGNLVENALVHGAGTVTLSASCRNGRVELHVVDEGRGFPPEFAGRAFDRFSRADEARPRSGSGLGLAIVNAIAQAHGGSAAVSPEGGKADVWIALPAGPEPRRATTRPLTSKA
jgi:two-component system, OmpR family, sensor kinase